jgi:ABC-type phosphate transport system auxiliary subunit
MSDEDMSFLASQSAQAMEGAPLAVEVREAPTGHEEDVRRLAQQVQDVEAVRVEAQQATAERLRVEEQLVKVQGELQSGKGDKATVEKRREEILRAYKTAYTNESDKKAEVQSKTGRVVVVWDSGGTRR